MQPGPEDLERARLLLRRLIHARSIHFAVARDGRDDRPYPRERERSRAHPRTREAAGARARAAKQREDAAARCTTSSRTSATARSAARSRARRAPGSCRRRRGPPRACSRRSTPRAAAARASTRGVANKLSPLARRPVGCPRAYRRLRARPQSRGVRAARSRPAPTSTSPRTSTSPDTSDGDKLIAHELAHVVQQRGAPTSGPLTVSNPGDAMENEADAVADKIAKLVTEISLRLHRPPRDGGGRAGRRRRTPIPAIRSAGSTSPTRSRCGSRRATRRSDADERLAGGRRARSGWTCSRPRCSPSAPRPSSTRATAACTRTCRTTSRASCRAPRLVGQLLEGEGLTPADVMVRLRRATGACGALGALKLLGDAQTPLAERPIKVADRLAAVLLGGRMDESAQPTRLRLVELPVARTRAPRGRGDDGGAARAREPPADRARRARRGHADRHRATGARWSPCTCATSRTSAT